MTFLFVPSPENFCISHLSIAVTKFYYLGNLWKTELYGFKIVKEQESITIPDLSWEHHGGGASWWLERHGALNIMVAGATSLSSHLVLQAGFRESYWILLVITLSKLSSRDINAGCHHVLSSMPLSVCLVLLPMFLSLAFKSPKPTWHF